MRIAAIPYGNLLISLMDGWPLKCIIRGNCERKSNGPPFGQSIEGASCTGTIFGLQLPTREALRVTRQFRRTMKTFAKLSLLTVLAISSAAIARADVIPVGSPGSTSSDWNQEFNTAVSGPFTSIVTTLVTPGVDFTGAFTGAPSFPSGWTSTLINPQQVDMMGPASAGNFDFFGGFTSLPSVPFVLDFYSYNGSTLLSYPNSNYLAWSGSAWTSGPLPAVPEPSSLLLFGTGLFGLAGALFLRMHGSTA